MFRILVILSLIISGALAKENSAIDVEKVEKFYNPESKEDAGKSKIIESISKEELPVNKDYAAKRPNVESETDDSKELSPHEKRSNQFLKEMQKPQQTIIDRQNTQRMKQGKVGVDNSMVVPGFENR